jgi:signal transduction histidine kinase
VTVRARPDGDAIEVTISDEGIGIRPDDRERVFERFVQGEAGDRRRFGGIGLGLYIVRQLARAQGGEVTAEGRTGPGTTMRLHLPQAGGPASDGSAVAEGVALSAVGEAADVALPSTSS